MRTECAGYDDVAFPSDASLTTVSGRFIGSFWLTPGNFGPHAGDQGAILLMYFVLVVIFSVASILMHEYQLVAEAKVDMQTIMPNDFAIMVKGLPKKLTNEDKIAEYFKKNAVIGQDNTQIVKVVIGFDVGEVKNKLKELKEAKQELEAALTPGGGAKNVILSMCTCCRNSDAYVTTSHGIEEVKEIKEIKKRISAIRAEVDQSDPGQTEISSSGIAVVVFRNQTDMRACLTRWNSWKNWCEGCCWSSRVPPPAEFDGEAVRVTVERAANPGDIHWEELGHTWQEKLKLSMWYSFLMFLLICVGFAATYGLNYFQIWLKNRSAEEDGSYEGYALQAASLLPATVVSLINCALRMAGRYCGDLEYQDTISEQEKSQFTKMSGAMFINMSLAVFVLNIRTTDWYEKGGLVDDVLFLLVMDAFFRLSLIVDYTWIMNYYIRRQVTKTRCDRLYKVVKQNYPPKDFEQTEKLEDAKVRIEAFKTAFEPEEFDSPDRYARALTTFLTACFYAPLFPMAALVGIVALVFQYGIDKLVLLRWSKRSRPKSAVQALWCVRLIKMMAPLSLTSGVVLFLMPSWNNKKQVFNFFLLSLIVSACVAVGPFGCWAWAFLCRCCSTWEIRRTSTHGLDEDYYSAQYMWPKDLKYHMDQFLYRQLHGANKEKNPEFLTPDGDHASKVSDLQAQYRNAVRQTAERSGKRRGRNKGRAGRAFVGGKVVDVADGMNPRSSEYAAKDDDSQRVCECIRPGCSRPTWNGKPGTFCGRTCRDKAIKGGPVTPVADPETGVDATAVVPIVLPETVGRPAGARGHWEYETGHGFSSFAEDCQETLEEQYQAFTNGSGSERVKVQSGGITISVDFKKMTQMVEGGHGVRKVQRKDRE